MGADVTLQVKGIVESLTTVHTLVLLVRRVITSMTIEHANMFKCLAAQITLEFARALCFFDFRFDC